MRNREGEGQQIDAEQGWTSIHATLDRSHNSMYMAGWTNIMLLWGAIVAVGYLSMQAIGTFAPEFAADYPWYPGPLWLGLAALGMIGSSIFGYRAGRQNASGPSARAAGLRVFGFWMAVVAAAFVIPAASGLWVAGSDPLAIGGVSVGIIALGYVLFGILHHPAISLVGVGIAASYYLPAHFAGDAAPVVSAALIIGVVAAAWLWSRKSGAA